MKFKKDIQEAMDRNTVDSGIKKLIIGSVVGGILVGTLLMGVVLLYLNWSTEFFKNTNKPVVTAVTELGANNEATESDNSIETKSAYTEYLDYSVLTLSGDLRTYDGSLIGGIDSNSWVAYDTINSKLFVSKEQPDSEYVVLSVDSVGYAYTNDNKPISFLSDITAVSNTAKQEVVLEDNVILLDNVGVIIGTVYKNQVYNVIGAKIGIVEEGKLLLPSGYVDNRDAYLFNVNVEREDYVKLVSLLKASGKIKDNLFELKGSLHINQDYLGKVGLMEIAKETELSTVIATSSAITIDEGVLTLVKYLPVILYLYDKGYDSTESTVKEDYKLFITDILKNTENAKTANIDTVLVNESDLLVDVNANEELGFITGSDNILKVQEALMFPDITVDGVAWEVIPSQVNNGKFVILYVKPKNIDASNFTEANVFVTAVDATLFFSSNSEGVVGVSKKAVMYLELAKAVMQVNHVYLTYIEKGKLSPATGIGSFDFDINITNDVNVSEYRYKNTTDSVDSVYEYRVTYTESGISLNLLKRY